MPEKPNSWKAPAFWTTLPEGGMRSVLPGGNTVGALLREVEPRDDGFRHVDTAATLKILGELGANHMFFGIWDSATDWDDLRLEFAPAAAAAGIQVLVYLVPPTETFEHGRASRPYRLDFVAWARAVAQLSLEHPNVTAWAIDDFDVPGNAELFTGEYLAEIRAAQFEINPDLGFFTCAYHHTATSERFMQSYGPYIDGVVYPFLDGPNCNTLVASTVVRDVTQINELGALHDVGLILLVYTGRFLDAPAAPTEQYVADVLSIATEQFPDLAIVSYGVQVDDRPTISDERRSMYGDGRGAIASSHMRIPAGSWAELVTTIRVAPDRARYELNFWHSRTFLARRSPAAGDLQFEVLVDGRAVWSHDLLDATWLGLWVQGHDTQGWFDIAEAVRGKTSVELAFRVTALRQVTNSTFDLGVDTIEGNGVEIADPGFEASESWQLRSSGGPMRSSVDIFVADRPARIRAAIASAYLSTR